MTVSGQRPEADHVAAPAANSTLPIYRDPAFRRLWLVGLLGSLIRWLEILAFGLFTYQQTQSAMWVASMTMLRMLPMGLFGVLFGAVAARISRRTGLLVSQGVLLATAVVLLVVSTLGVLEVWHLALASFISGTAWAVDMPMRRGLIGDIAGPLRMGKAMAIDSAANNGCRLAGPSLGGLLLATGGLTVVFVFSVVLYVLVVAAMLTLSEKHALTSADGPKPSIWAMLIGGFQTARDTAQLRAVLCITIIFNLFGWPVLSMVPVIGQERLQLSTQAVGLLASMDGVGALLGAIVLMAVARRSLYGHVYIGGVLLVLVTLPLFALSKHPLLTGAALLVVGIGQSGFAAMQATLVYVAVPQHRRLEALGLLTMCIGISPVGFLAVGRLAEWLGAPTAAVISSICGLVGMALTRRVWRLCLREAPASP